MNKLLDYLHPKFKAAGVLGAIVALGLKALQGPGSSVHLTGFEQSLITLAGALVAAFVRAGPAAAVTTLEADIPGFLAKLAEAKSVVPLVSTTSTTTTAPATVTFGGAAAPVVPPVAPLADVGEVAPVNLPPVIPPIPAAQPPAAP